MDCIGQLYCLIPEKYGGKICPPCVKIGKHKNMNRKRIQVYGSNAKFLRVIAINNCDVVERELITEFKKKFKVVMGLEFFDADPVEAVKLFDKITGKYELVIEKDMKTEKESKDTIIKICELGELEYYKWCCRKYCHRECAYNHFLDYCEKNGVVSCPDCKKSYVSGDILVANRSDKITRDVHQDIKKCQYLLVDTVSPQSVLEVGMAVANQKKILIVPDDSIFFDEDTPTHGILPPIDYRIWWTIYKYNYKLTEDEASILFTNLALYHKFYDYESYQKACWVYEMAMYKYYEIPIREVFEKRNLKKILLVPEQHDISEELMEACISGDLEKLKTIASFGIDLSPFDELIREIVYYGGKTEILQILNLM